MSEAKEEEKTEKSFSGKLSNNSNLFMNVIGVVTGSVSLFYVFGYIIVNLRLLNIGVRDFALGNPTYLAAGISFMVFITVFIIIPTWAGCDLKKRDEKIKPNSEDSLKIRLLGIIFYNMFIPLLSAFSSVMVIEQISSTRDNNFFIWSFVLVLFIVTVGIVIFDRFNGPLEVNHKQIPVYWLMSLIFTILVLFILWVLTWSNYIYPQIKAGFGGGQPVTVQLVISDDKNATLFTQIGIAINKNTTEPIQLLDDTGTTLIVVLSNGNAARIDKSLIANILYISPRTLTPPTLKNTSTPVAITITATP